jgi:26S proteasome regulatory subunit N5
VKIFVEVERARITRYLSQIKKSQGDLNSATDILCELQVETFGSMSRREKTEFILEQVGLCIERGDWTQASILSRKINKRYFARKPKKTPEQLEKEQKEYEERLKTRASDEPMPEKDESVEDLKLRYYEQQIILSKHDRNYLDTCKHYRDVLDTESVEEDPERLRAVSELHLVLRKRAQLTWDRSSRGLSTTSYSPHTTTINRISSTAYTKIVGCHRSPWKLVL